LIGCHADTFVNGFAIANGEVVLTALAHHGRRKNAKEQAE
jgi:hypothetical protein